MKQLIQIGLTTSSRSESFRILKVYLDRNDSENPVLVVVSKRSDPPSCLCLATIGNHNASIEVEIPGDQLLPVKHYVIGLKSNYLDSHDSKAFEKLELEESPSSSKYDYLPNVPFRRLNSQKDLILSNKVQLLYENPETEEIEAKEYESIQKENMKLLEELREFGNYGIKEQKETKERKKAVPPRTNSPHLADASACVGSTSSQYNTWEMPFYVKALACLAVGAFGIIFFESL